MESHNCMFVYENACPFHYGSTDFLGGLDNAKNCPKTTFFGTPNMTKNISSSFFNVLNCKRSRGRRK